jgi:hypothetical protein
MADGDRIDGKSRLSKVGSDAVHRSLVRGRINRFLRTRARRRFYEVAVGDFTSIDNGRLDPVGGRKWKLLSPSRRCVRGSCGDRAWHLRETSMPGIGPAPIDAAKDSNDTR